MTFPRTISSGFTGTPENGGGRVNLQFSNKVQPCTEGYKPKQRVAAGPTSSPTRRSSRRECASPPPYNMRGTQVRPGGPGPPCPRAAPTGARTTRVTGLVDGAVDAEGDPVRFLDQGNLSVLGGDAWKWLLVGPVAQRVSPGPHHHRRLNIALYVAGPGGVVLSRRRRRRRAGLAAPRRPRRRRRRAGAVRRRAGGGDAPRPRRSSTSATTTPRPASTRSRPAPRASSASSTPRPTDSVDRGAPAEQVGHGRRGALGRSRRRRQGQRDRHRGHLRHRRQQRRPTTSRSASNFRLQLELVYEDGRWLTRDLQFVS